MGDSAEMNIRPTKLVVVCTIVAAMLLLSFAASATAQMPAEKPKPAIELGAPFADNAILQRQMPVPIWGWSKPGTKVAVEFAGQKKTATAGKDGKWMLRLDPLSASTEGRELRCQVSGVREQERGPGIRALTPDSRLLTP